MSKSEVETLVDRASDKASDSREFVEAVEAKIELEEIIRLWPQESELEEAFRRLWRRLSADDKRNLARKVKRDVEREEGKDDEAVAEDAAERKRISDITRDMVGRR